MPFGFDYLNHQLVKNGAEQAAIRMMRQYRAGGLSLREIAGDLNLNLIPTKESTQNKRYSLMVRQKDCRRFRIRVGEIPKYFRVFGIRFRPPRWKRIAILKRLRLRNPQAIFLMR